MFRAVYPNAVKFKYIAQTLAKITDDVPFIASTEGLKASVLSPDKTTMIVLSLPSVAFEEYEVEEQEMFIVSSSDLNKIARRGTRNNALELALEKEERRLRLSFLDRKAGLTRTFYVPLREGVVGPPKEIKLELPVSVRMLASDFKDILRDAKLVGDEVELVAENHKLEAVCVTQQKEYYNIMEEGAPLVSIMNASGSKVSARYSLDALQATLKATSAADALTLEVGQDLPLKLVFELPEGGTLTYWVAPRI